MEDFHCTVCREIYYEPITLSCGHSFCRDCITESLKVQPVCPICRIPCLVNAANLKESLVIRNILQLNHYSEYKKREESVLSERRREIKLQNEQQKKENQIGGGSVEMKFENKILIDTNFPYYFPGTIKQAKIRANMSIQQLLTISTDGLFIFTIKNEKELGMMVQVFNFKPSESNLSQFMIEFNVKERVKVNLVKYLDEQSQSGEQFNLKVCDGYMFKDARNDFYDMQFLKKSTQTMIEFVHDQTQLQNSEINQTHMVIQQRIQKMGLFKFLTFDSTVYKGYQDISEFTLLLCSFLNLNEVEAKELWITNNLIERISLMLQIIKKFNDCNNVEGLSFITNINLNLPKN